ncbi:MAG TPA: hypothetical protein VHB77_03805 [Planctomycetaceae bacterium]|nr:hypothetical protein [Planctomycetaceae bacterium]
MALGIYPAFNPHLKLGYDAEGQALLDEHEVLCEIAAERGITPITDFSDNRSAPDDWDGDPEELEDMLGRWDEWFPAAEGLQCVEALLRLLETDAATARRLENPEMVVDELQCLARSLRQAHAAGVEFRLEVG